MGLSISDIVPTKTLEIEHLKGRAVAIDAYNTLYQFISSIRQPDGTPLMNSKSQITSHLTGLLYRTNKLIENDVRPVYVFDGVPPEKKHETILERVRIREEAKKKWKQALQQENLEEAHKYAQQSVRLSKEMVEQSKHLLDLMGVPHVQAPSEGESQASFMAAQGDVWAAASQDFDCLLFGAPRLIRNITISGRRKLPRKNVYVDVHPELLELEDVLTTLKLTREELVELALWVGTDYNKGVKGIGQKKALEKVHAKEFRGEEFDVVRKLFLEPDVTKEYSLQWKDVNQDAMLAFLCDENDFSRDRVKKVAENMQEHFDLAGSQSRLDSWM